MNVKPQNSVNDVNDDTEEEENDVYDVEVLFKSHNLRKRMDLSVRVIHNLDDEELYVYNTFIKVSERTFRLLIKDDFYRIFKNI